MLVIPRYQGLELRLITNSAEWSPRHQAQVGVFNPETNQTSGSLVLYGGCNDAFYNTGRNDVWVSTNTGYSWSARSLRPDEIFSSSTINSYCSDRFTGTSYAIPQSSYQTWRSNTTMWISYDQIQWRPKVPQPTSAFTDRYGGSCWVDSSSQMYYTFGINSTAANKGNYQGYSDVWISQDQGSNWRNRSGDLNFQTRYNAQIGTYLKSATFASDVVYVLGGQSGNGSSWNVLVDDLWASSDGSQTWQPICDSACLPWNHALPVNTTGTFQAEAFYISNDGLLIVSVNGQWIDIGGAQNSRSDIWISFNGGWNWDLCIQNAAYGSRRDPTLFTDSAGYLYILGGFTDDLDYVSYNDIWKTSISMLEVNLLADSCGTTLPSCGTGIRDWNGPCRDTPSSSLIKIIVPSLVVPVTVCVIVVLIGYLYKRYRSGARSQTRNEAANLIQEAELQLYPG